MVRRLVHLLTALSLLLLVGSLAMWIRGSFTSDVWTRVRVTPASDRPGGDPVVITDYVVSRDGGVLLRRTRVATVGLRDPPPLTKGRWQHNAGFFMVPAWVLPRVATAVSLPGLRFGHLTTVPTANAPIPDHDSELEARYWLMALLSAVAVALLQFRGVARWTRRRGRRRRGRCPDCGYDLRGGNERCPECGTPVAVPEQTRGFSNHG
jgi:hypothetical protein